MTDQLDDYRWLVSDEAAPWLSQLAACMRPSVAEVRELRRRCTPARAHLLLEQVALRHRAALKFERAAQMFFTRTGLEQATDQWIAGYKASRFAPDRPIVDFCCGVGGDVLELAARGPVVGVDWQPVHALLAQANVEVCGRTAGRVETGDAGGWPLTPEQAWHMDPDRRPEGERTSQLFASQPSPAVIEQLQRAAPDAAVKLAPAAEVPDAWQAIAERQWIGSGRECRQQMVWFGQLAQYAGRRTAIVVDRQGEVSPLLSGDALESCPIAATFRRYIYDPHAAVVAAHLTTELARQFSLEAIGSRCAYLTGDQAIDDLRLQAFEITEVLPFDLRRLRALMRERRIGQLEVKKRGVDIDPRQVQRTLQSSGQEQAVLLITRQAGAVRAVLARRVALPIESRPVDSRNTAQQ